MGRSLKRRSRQKNLRTTILIVCGGEQTEANYFKSFPVDTRVVNVNVKAYAKDPRKLVDYAIKHHDEQTKTGTPYNQVWCVFDKDEFTADHFNTAVRYAEQNRIRVAYSNQSFELWYCLHFSYIESALHRDQYCRKLADQLGQYEKNDPDMYNKLKSSQKKALAAAQRLYAKSAHMPPACQDPVTLVYRLVEKLGEFIKQKDA